MKRNHSKKETNKQTQNIYLEDFTLSFVFFTIFLFYLTFIFIWSTWPIINISKITRQNFWKFMLFLKGKWQKCCIMFKRHLNSYSSRICLKTKILKREIFIQKTPTIAIHFYISEIRNFQQNNILILWYTSSSYDVWLFHKKC